MPFLKAITGSKGKRAEKADPLAHTENLEYELTGHEKDLTDNLQSLFRRATHLKKDVQQRMKRSEEIYRTGLLDDDIPEIKGIAQNINTNFGKALVKNVQARITDTNPRPVVVKRNPDDKFFAELIDDTLRWVLDVNDWKEIRDDLIVDCTKNGVGFAKVMWDQSMEDGKGNIRIDQINPMRVFPGSNTDCVSEMDQLFIYHSEPVSKVVEKFVELNTAVDKETGDLKVADSDIQDKVAAAAGDEPFSEKDFDQLVDRILPATGMDAHKQNFLKDMQTPEMSATAGHEAVGPKDNVNYVEAYIRYPQGHDLHEIYPKGRLVYFCSEGILGDFAWQKDHWPIVKFELEPEGGDYFWNEPIVMAIASIQRAVNSLSSLIMKASTVHAFPPFLTTPNSGIKRDEFENVGPANRVLYVSPEGMQAGAGWMEPPRIPKAAFQLRENLIKEMEQILGVHDITQGRTPGSIQSGAAIARLQEADKPKERMKTRGFDKGLKRLGELIVENIQDHFTQERFISVGDKPANQSIALNQRMDVKKAKQKLRNQTPRDDQQALRTIQRARQQQLANERIEEGVEEVILNDPTIANVDVRIGGGKDTPVSQVAKQQDAMQLAELGMIDARGVLEALDWDDRERILRKIDREKQLADQVEGLQRRLERRNDLLNEIVNTVDLENQKQIRSAINSMLTKQR